MNNENAANTLEAFGRCLTETGSDSCAEACRMGAAALRTPPATGAAAMREAAAKVAEDYEGTDGSAYSDGCDVTATNIAAAIRALPAPEVPEEVKAWCGHFRTCVAYSDKEDIWPEADFNLLAYFEKEYPDA